MFLIAELRLLLLFRCTPLAGIDLDGDMLMAACLVSQGRVSRPACVLRCSKPSIDRSMSEIADTMLER